MYLREKRGFKQIEIAEALNLKRSTYANYESGVTEPKLDTLGQFANFFGISADKLLFTNLADVHHQKQPTTETSIGEPDSYYTIQDKRVLEQLKNHNLINAALVPAQAKKSYLFQYDDPDFIQQLPVYNLPNMQKGIYRIFEVDDMAMCNTLEDKDKVVGCQVQAENIIDGRIYVLITRNEGILIRRVENRLYEGKLICKSDNTNHYQYPDIILTNGEVLEVWCVLERWTSLLSGPDEVAKRLMELETDMAILKQALNRKKEKIKKNPE